MFYSLKRKYAIVRKESAHHLTLLTLFWWGCDDLEEFWRFCTVVWWCCDVSRCSIEVVMCPGFLEVVYSVLLRLWCLQLFYWGCDVSRYSGSSLLVFVEVCDVSRCSGGSLLCSDEVMMSPGILEVLYCVLMRICRLQVFWRCCIVFWLRVLRFWTSSRRTTSSPSSPCWTNMDATTRSGWKSRLTVVC